MDAPFPFDEELDEDPPPSGIQFALFGSLRPSCFCAPPWNGSRQRWMAPTTDKISSSTPKNQAHITVFASDGGRVDWLNQLPSGVSFSTPSPFILTQPMSASSSTAFFTPTGSGGVGAWPKNSVIFLLIPRLSSIAFAYNQVSSSGHLNNSGSVNASMPVSHLPLEKR